VPPTELEPTIRPIDTLDLSGLIIDAHQDIGWNWLEFGRDPALSAEEGRAAEDDSIVRLIGERTTGLPNNIAGGVGIVFSTIFVMPERDALPGQREVVYSAPSQAHELGMAQVEAYRNWADESEQVQIIETKADLVSVLRTWDAAADADSRKVGLVLLMEGADPIRQPDEVSLWWDAGVRLVGPAWHRTQYAGGTSEPGGLTDIGFDLVREMQATGMVLDTAHLAEEAFFDAMDSFDGMVVYTHGNSRKFLPTDRGISDEMILRLAERDGVIGIALFNFFLDPEWRFGGDRLPIDAVADSIDYIVQLTGSTDHVALGTDMDGGLGLNAIPQGINTTADLPLIRESLAERGYRDADLDAVMSGNWLRVLSKALPA